MIPNELVVPVLAVVLWYLASSATLTQPLWSRYPKWLDAFLLCPACSGTWWSVSVSATLGRPFLGFEGRTPANLALSGLWGCFFVPLLAWLLNQALTPRT